MAEGKRTLRPKTRVSGQCSLSSWNPMFDPQSRMACAHHRDRETHYLDPKELQFTAQAIRRLIATVYCQDFKIHLFNE